MNTETQPIAVPLHSCTCGRKPQFVQDEHGHSRYACFHCTISGLTSPDVLNAGRSWNLKIEVLTSNAAVMPGVRP